MSHNEQLKSIAKRILLKFPNLRNQLIQIRDGSNTVIDTNRVKTTYKNDFLNAIKNEVEVRKETILER